MDPLSTHMPMPLQKSAGKSVLPWHDAAPQFVLGLYCAQAPAPLQVPVLPQLAWGSAVQSSFGSVSPLTLPQTPSEPLAFLAARQVLQVPLQALLQHTPSTQKPLEQS